MEVLGGEQLRDSTTTSARMQNNWCRYAGRPIILSSRFPRAPRSDCVFFSVGGVQHSQDTVLKYFWVLIAVPILLTTQVRIVGSMSFVMTVG